MKPATFAIAIYGLSLLVNVPTMEAQTQTAAKESRTSVTFANDVAAIIYERCSICHRPDQVGPFPLLTYEDVSRRAKTIQAVVTNGYMPPWKAVDHGMAWSNDRSLTSLQKQKLNDWIEAGCPSGDLAKAPPPPKFTEGWTLGPPDMVVKMKGEFKIPADGPDLYRSFVFPVDLPEDKWVKAVELRPRAKSAVHHAIFFLDTTGNAKKLDGVDGQAGIAGMGFLANFAGNETDNSTAQNRGSGLLERLRNGSFPVGAAEGEEGRIDSVLARGLGGYVPGAMPTFLPGDLAMELPRASDVVMQTHFHPSGKPETEQAELALYFADKPPTKRLVPIQVPAMFGFGANIKIPAGDKSWLLNDSFTIPVGVQVIGVGGHAHYICREMKMSAQTPAGDKIVLLEIDDWDMDWQDRYQFAKPVELPAGTVIHAEIVYDNSADNPENPFHPPREIRWGRESNDEMGSLTLMVVAADEANRPELQSAVREHFTRSIISSFSSGRDLAKMLMQLDQNRDGKLQQSEAPPRLNARVFSLLDRDSDGNLDEDELDKLKELMDRFGAGRRN